MKLTIETCDNGFLVKRECDESESTVITVFEDRDNLEHYQQMCYHILECLGYVGSKHDEERLWVEIRKNK